MAITRLGGANAISGTIPQGNIANASLGAVTALPAAIPTGKVLQVVQTTKLDHFSTTNNYASLTDVTGLSVSITPSSSSNKVFVMVQIMGSVSGTTEFIQLVRDSTNILIPSGGSFPATIANDGGNTYPGTINFLDSPSTTSATTYKIKIGAQAGTAHVNARQDDTTNHKFTSTITAMEISA